MIHHSSHMNPHIQGLYTAQPKRMMLLLEIFSYHYSMDIQFVMCTSNTKHCLICGIVIPCGDVHGNTEYLYLTDVTYLTNSNF
jgi:hypothetical protein